MSLLLFERIRWQDRLSCQERMPAADGGYSTEPTPLQVICSAHTEAAVRLDAVVRIKAQATLAHFQGNSLGLKKRPTMSLGCSGGWTRGRRPGWWSHSALSSRVIYGSDAGVGIAISSV